MISATQRPLPDNTQHSQQTNIHAPLGFEPTISAGKRPQTYASDRTATGTSNFAVTSYTCLDLVQPLTASLDAHTHTLCHPNSLKNCKYNITISLICVHICCYRLNLNPNIYIFQHGCYLITKIYTEDTKDICRHKETWNDLLAPPNTRHIME